MNKSYYRNILETYEIDRLKNLYSQYYNFCNTCNDLMDLICERLLKDYIVEKFIEDLETFDKEDMINIFGEDNEN